jgi:hypothetical protein
MVAAFVSSHDRVRTNASIVAIWIMGLSPGLVSYSTAAADYQVSEIQSAGAINCVTYRRGWIFPTTAPCSDFKPPESVRLGERFSEQGTTHFIRVIIARQAERDYEYQGRPIKEGQWFCLAAETPQDLGDRKHRRTWLYVLQCVPK